MSKPAIDFGKGEDTVHIMKGNAIVIKDEGKRETKWRIDKFNDPTNEIAKFLQSGGSIEDAIVKFGNYIGFSEFEGNVMLNEGIQAFEELLAGISTPTLWNNANARVGVGDSNAAEDPTHTGLQAAVNKFWRIMDSGYPRRSAQEVTWRGTFGGTEANYSWQEFTVVNAANDAGQNLNRKISNQGTKTSGQTWVLSVKITWS